MKVEIITIGDEILIGQIVDTNSAWMASQLHEIGIEVAQVSSISDNKKHILDALGQALERADVVLITGGLGPTKDDITKLTLAEYFEDELEFRPEVFEHVKGLFDSLNIPMPEVNREQAMLPSKAKHLMNEKGTAPGMWFEDKGKIVVSMPGVPFEMKYLMTEEILPRLSEKTDSTELVYKTILTQGIGESGLMEHIGGWEDDLLNSGLGLAWLPSMGRVKLRVSGKGDNRIELETKIQKQVDLLKSIIPQYFVGEDVDEIEIAVANLLIEKGWTVSTAESCTGGYVAHRLTSISGSSAYFEGSVVSYSNRIKETVLGVSWESLKKHGAVSKQVVEEMVEGVKQKFDTDCSIATSGIAGPTGGTKEKPVGTVWIAVSTPSGTISQCFRFGKDRDKNIVRSAQTGLRMLQKEILKHS
ncbi:MAG: competence/damage-inducible protein A [Crocinitomicaceae bacterium]|nr:competence/damage-inducible protein A [Crocinitomicaceae bacterium]|tara:strand:- start:5527 stop:6774 length:1248 start_codon:yes stop_codon:yes gene_type:complete